MNMLGALLEAFNPAERRGFHGKWVAGGGLLHKPDSAVAIHPTQVAPIARQRVGASSPAGAVKARYGGGVVRMSSQTRSRLLSVFSKSEGASQKHPQPHKDIDALHAQARAVQPEFDRMMAGVAKSLGGVQHHDLNKEGGFRELGRAMASRRHLAHVISGPLKKLEGARTKVNGKYKGDASKINDLVRGTVAVPHVDDLPHAVEHVRKSLPKGWTMHAPENRFVRGRQGDVVNTGDAGGYRDISMILRSPSGHNTELQITTTHLLHAKEGPGHSMYEESRILRAQKRTREQEQRYQHLVQKSRELYDKALLQSSRPRSQSQQNVIPPLSSVVRRRIVVRPVVRR